jgi:hypothetical protein
VTRRLILVLLSYLACSRAGAEDGLLPDGHLDTAAVRDAYLRADMPFARAALEGFVKNHPRQVGDQEKVFTHLYLGAILAGEKDGRARAEAHFRAALKLDPYSDPANLYLPPSTKTWFERLRADVLRAQAQEEPPSAAPASSPLPAPEPGHPDKVPERPMPASPRETAPADTPTIPMRAPAPDRSQGSASGPPSPEASVAAASPSRGWLWWTLGAAAAAGAGAFAWAEINSRPEPRRQQVDATLK